MFKKTLFIFATSLFSLLAVVSLAGQTALAADTKESCGAKGGVWVEDGTERGTCNTDVGPKFETDPNGEKVKSYLQNGVNLLTALAGLAITASVIIGGIQYSTSGGNPQAAASAKKRIGNAILALLALVFLYTFLQWLVPGGIFGS